MSLCRQKWRRQTQRQGRVWDTGQCVPDSACSQAHHEDMEQNPAHSSFGSSRLCSSRMSKSWPRSSPATKGISFSCRNIEVGVPGTGSFWIPVYSCSLPLPFQFSFLSPKAETRTCLSTLLLYIV